MIRLTRMNHQQMYLNPDLIEMMEQTPDTVLTLVSGQKHMVLEPPDDVVDRVVEYRRRILSGLQPPVPERE